MDHVQDFLGSSILDTLFQHMEIEVKDWFGAAYHIQPQISFFRRCQNNAKGSVGWHCDAEAASTIKVGTDCITAWLPLDPVGRELPSLEMIVGSHNIMSKRPPNDYDGFHRANAWVSELPGTHIVPVIEIMGHAMIFSQFTLHRTQPLDASVQRRSCEFRFVK